MTALVIASLPDLMIFVKLGPESLRPLAEPFPDSPAEIANLPGLGYLQLFFWLPFLPGPLLCPAWRVACPLIVREMASLRPLLRFEVPAATLALV